MVHYYYSIQNSIPQHLPDMIPGSDNLYIKINGLFKAYNGGLFQRFA